MADYHPYMERPPLPPVPPELLAAIGAKFAKRPAGEK